MGRHRKQGNVLATIAEVLDALWRGSLVAVGVVGLVWGFASTGAVTIYAGWHNGGFTVNGSCGHAWGVELYGHPGVFNPCTDQ